MTFIWIFKEMNIKHDSEAEVVCAEAIGGFHDCLNVLHDEQSTRSNPRNPVRRVLFVPYGMPDGKYIQQHFSPFQLFVMNDFA
jgi:hypothetical protein